LIPHRIQNYIQAHCHSSDEGTQQLTDCASPVEILLAHRLRDTVHKMLDHAPAQWNSQVS